jgi:hypothetical protein
MAVCKNCRKNQTGAVRVCSCKEPETQYAYDGYVLPAHVAALFLAQLTAGTDPSELEAVQWDFEPAEAEKRDLRSKK